MPLDTSIALGGVAPQFQSPLTMANTLAQLQASQQEQDTNQLKLQAWQEDRATAQQARQLAASNALAEKMRQQKLRGVYEAGYKPEQPVYGGGAVNGSDVVMGPGTVQGAKPAAFDFDKTALKLLSMGETAKAEELFKIPEARRVAGAEFTEKDAKARVEALNADAATYDKALKEAQTVLKQATSLDGILHYVDVVAANPTLSAIADRTGGTVDQRKEHIRQMAKPIAEGGLGMSVDQIAQRLQGIDGYQLKSMQLDLNKKEADTAKANADAAKARSEANGGGAAGTENERNRALYAKAMTDPNYVNTPEYAALFYQSFGPKVIPVQNSNGQITYTIVDVPAPSAFPRPTYKQQGAPTNALLTPPNLGVDAQQARTGAVMPPAPSTLPPTTAAAASTSRTAEGLIAKEPPVSAAQAAKLSAVERKIEGANTVVDLDKDVRELLGAATSGGLQKLGANAYAYATGGSTSGMLADAKLKTLQANLLFANLPNGSLGGQISDTDREQINKLSGDIGNTDLPTDARLAAWETVTNIAKKYLDKKSSPTAVAPTAAAKNLSNVPARNAKGWVLHTDKNGNQAYVSPDGKNYEEVK